MTLGVQLAPSSHKTFMHTNARLEEREGERQRITRRWTRIETPTKCERQKESNKNDRACLLYTFRRNTNHHNTAAKFLLIKMLGLERKSEEERLPCCETEGKVKNHTRDKKRRCRKSGVLQCYAHTGDSAV